MKGSLANLCQSLCYLEYDLWKSQDEIALCYQYLRCEGKPSEDVRSLVREALKASGQELGIEQEVWLRQRIPLVCQKKVPGDFLAS